MSTDSVINTQNQTAGAADQGNHGPGRGNEPLALHLENVTMQFGGVVSVNNLTLDVTQGKIIALIGPNGAGKTTAFNCITGVYQPTNGLIEFMGQPMVRTYPRGKDAKIYKGQNREKYAGQHVLTPTPDQITQLGIARTFQNIRLWKSMTVFENVLTAKHMRAKQNVFSAILRMNLAEEKRMREETMDLLREQGLETVKDELATSLPYELADFVQEIREKYGLTVFLIEHHMDLVMNISDYIYVIDFGSEIAQGVPETVQSDRRVIEAYLGISEDQEGKSNP